MNKLHRFLLVAAISLLIAISLAAVVWAAELELEVAAPERVDWQQIEKEAREQMKAAINRPVAGPMRAVDTFPMMLEHLGHGIPDGIDGRLRPPERKNSPSRDGALTSSAQGL